MIVVCLYPATMPQEVQMAYGDGAGSVQLIAAARLLRAEAERLAGGAAPPEGRGQTGEVGSFQNVAAGDVCVSVAWPDPEGPPVLDYSVARTASADQLLTAAVALDEFVRFSIWSSRMSAQQQLQQAQQSRERAAQAIVQASRMPPNLGRVGRD